MRVIARVTMYKANAETALARRAGNSCSRIVVTCLCICLRSFLKSLPKPSVVGRLKAMQNRIYKSELTDTEWAIVSPLIPEPKTNGRRATVPRRWLLDAMFYVTKTGCGWEWLPHDFPNWKTVYHYFRLWRLIGLWQQV